jgi:tetratricopeptide (TPR) repeat protein
MLWKAKEDVFTIPEKSIFTGMLAAYFIHNVFVFDNLISYLMYVMVVAYIYHRTAHGLGEEGKHIKNKFALPVVAVALVLVLYTVNIRPMLASIYLIDAISQSPVQNDITQNINYFKKALSYHTFGDQEIREQILTTSSSVISTIQKQQIQVVGKEELLALAGSVSADQILETPLDARAYVLSASYFGQIGDAASATKMLEKALKLSPKKQQIMFALSSIYITQKKYADAAAQLKQAYEVEPSYKMAQMLYAAGLIYIKDDAAFKALMSGVSSSTIAADNDIMSAYYATKQYDKLIELWKIRIADNPADINQKISLAAVQAISGDKQSAIKGIQAIIKENPTFKEQGDEFIRQIKEIK